MVVLWGPQCNSMSPIYVKMSKFRNVLLAFNFSKLLINQEKLTGEEDTSQATPKSPCGALVCGVWVTQGKNIQNSSGTLFAYEIFEIAQKTNKLAFSSIHHRKLCRKIFWNFLRPSQIFAYIIIFLRNSTCNFQNLFCHFLLKKHHISSNECLGESGGRFFMELQ